MNPNQNTNTGMYPAADSATAPGMSSPPSPPLQRGKACLACRRRKIRCDGARPVCTPCLRGERAEDCEFTDGPRRPRTLLLEEDIARLRARVQELENPEEASPSVGLYDPYGSADASTGSSTSSSASVIRAQSQAPSPVFLHHAIGRRQAPPPAYPTGSGSEPNRGDPQADIQMHARRALSVISPHAAELGFFLNPDRLRLQGTRILPALQSMLALWSAHITSASEPDHAQVRERTEAYKATLLSQAQTQLISSLNTIDSEPDPAIILHGIQTGVLLVYYMQRVGQEVGARYYASGTWTLAIMLKLYRGSHVSVGASEGEGQVPRASRVQARPTTGNTAADPDMHLFAFAGCTTSLPPALDEIEAEERTRAFWAVYALDRWFGAVCKAPFQSLAMDRNAGNAMTVQWPGVGGVDQADSNVIQRFINDPNHNFTQDGALAMHAKASVLLGEATGFVVSYLADRAVSQSPAFGTHFATLGTLLSRCFSTAMSMATSTPHGRQSRQTPEQSQAFVTLHLVALAHVVLHRPWLSTYAPSQRRCLDAALGVVRVLDRLGDAAAAVGTISPIYATVWTALCLILHDDIRRRRARPDPDPSHRREEEEMVRAIRKLVGLLSALSQHYPNRFFAANIEAVLPVLESIAS